MSPARVPEQYLIDHCAYERVYLLPERAQEPYMGALHGLSIIWLRQTHKERLRRVYTISVHLCVSQKHSVGAGASGTCQAGRAVWTWRANFSCRVPEFVSIRPEVSA